MSRSAPDQELWTSLAGVLAGRPADLAAYGDEDILHMAREHGVMQLLDRAWRDGRVVGLAEAVTGELAAASRDQAALDLLQKEGTRRTLAVLAAQGIKALLLKGLPLACLHYPRSLLRPRFDTDMLIPAKAVEPAAAALGEAGYHVTGLEAPRATSRQFGASFGFQGQRLHMDLHWTLSNRPMFHAALTFDDCWPRRQAIPELGAQAFALGNADLLLHACIHRIAHGRNTGRNRLVWLYDIHLLFTALDETARAEFTDRALDRQVGALSADALLVCAALFGTELPPGYLRVLQENADLEPSGRLIHASRTRWAVADLMAVQGLGAKARYAKALLLNRRGD